MHNYFKIAIVGRANVGKSTIFNRILGKKKAMVSDIPRVTRDRNIETCLEYDKPFVLIDTGGFEKLKGDQVSGKIEEQVNSAIKEANVLFFVVDGKHGITPLDTQLFSEIRRLREDFEENVYLLINKVDEPDKHGDREIDFYELGAANIRSVSAEFSVGISDLVDEVLEKAPEIEDEQETEDHDELPKLVVVGKPNVGKSSFINKVLGEDRIIVHDMSGTTRDPVDVKVNWEGRDFLFIDTAGMRKKAKVTESVERLSVMFAERQVERADIVLLMLDGSDEPSDQDIRMAKIVEERYKAFVVVVNKSDLIRENETTKSDVREKIRDKFYFLSHIPINFISVKTGEGFDSLYKKIVEVEEEYTKRIPTSKLNKFYKDVISRHAMPIRRGKRPKVYYMTQDKSSPPTFIMFCNYPEYVEKSYKRYIINKIREEFNFMGSPVRLLLRKKS